MAYKRHLVEIVTIVWPRIIMQRNCTMTKRELLLAPHGWLTTAYGVLKSLVTAGTYLVGRTHAVVRVCTSSEKNRILPSDDDDVFVNSPQCHHPGWRREHMAFNRGHVTPTLPVVRTKSGTACMYDAKRNARKVQARMTERCDHGNTRSVATIRPHQAHARGLTCAEYYGVCSYCTFVTRFETSWSLSRVQCAPTRRVPSADAS